MSEELRPCPFCGSKVEARSDDKAMNYVIRCPEWTCEAEMRDMRKRNLIESWNRRAVDVDAVLEKVAVAIENETMFDDEEWQNAQRIFAKIVRSFKGGGK